MHPSIAPACVTYLCLHSRGQITVLLKAKQAALPIVMIVLKFKVSYAGMYSIFNLVHCRNIVHFLQQSVSSGRHK